MFCKGCVAREQAAQAHLAQQEEQHRVLQHEEIKRQASRKIRWSYIIGVLAAVFYSGFGLIGAAEGSVPLPLALVLVFGGPYVIWSTYWGLVWYWPYWKKFVRSFRQSLSGWILIARPFTWLLILMFYVAFYFSIPLSIAIYYGIFGGGIYQFRRHLRLASGRGPLEAAPDKRSRNLKIGAGIAIFLLLSFSLSTWLRHERIARQLAFSQSSATAVSYVSDQAYVLDSVTAKSINDLCAQANDKYKVQIAVFTVASLNGTTIQSLAQNLLQQQSGGGTEGRTVIILLVPKNRAWRIQYGNGFGATLTTSDIQAIGNNAVPSLKAKNYGAALLTMVSGVIAALEREPGLKNNGMAQATTPIPKGVKSKLDQMHPGWKLAEMSDEDRKTCFNKNSKYEPTLIWGDFDGDGKQDYAAIITYGNSWAVIALLARGTGYQAFELFAPSQSYNRAPDVLDVVPKGGQWGITAHKLQHESIAMEYCEASSVISYYENGAFHRFATED